MVPSAAKWRYLQPARSIPSPPRVIGVNSAFPIPGDLDLWPLTLAFKLIRAKDLTPLPCEFGAIRSAIPEIFNSQTIKNKKATDSAENITCGNRWIKITLGHRKRRWIFIEIPVIAKLKSPNHYVMVIHYNAYSRFDTIPACHGQTDRRISTIAYLHIRVHLILIHTKYVCGQRAGVPWTDGQTGISCAADIHLLWVVCVCAENRLCLG